MVGCSGVKKAVPCAKASARLVVRSNCARRCARRRASSVAVAATGAADDDLVLLDRDLDGPVARPVLRVGRVVLDGGVEPQPVALLAVVEGPLERPRRVFPAARPGALAGALARRGLRVLAASGSASSSAARLAASSASLASSSARRAASASSSAAMAASSSARRSTSSIGSPVLSPSASSSFSRLKDWICWTVTSSWWAIHASVRPCRTHPRIWLSWGRNDRRLMAGGDTSARPRTSVRCRPHWLYGEMSLTSAPSSGLL